MGETLTAIFRGCQLVSRETARNIAVAEYRGQALGRAMAKAAQIRKDENPLRTAITKFMAAKELKPTPWAEKAGINESTFRSFLNGKARALRHDTLEKLAKAAETTIAEITGEALTAPKTGTDVISVPYLKVKAAAGGGVTLMREGRKEPLYFRRRWIMKALGDEPAELRVMDVTGKSMYPTIDDGDTVLVRVSNQPGEEFVDGAPYVLWDGTGLVIKRLERLVGNDDPEVTKLRVISDNRALHDPYEVTSDAIHIAGRVIWRGGNVL